MNTLLLSKDEQGIVIFHVWKSLTYQTRLFLSFFLIIIGFVLQYFSLHLFPGVLFVFAGNLLLLVKGYDNRIKLGKFRHDAEWIKADKEQFDNIITINRKAKKWDISAFDITSGRGVLFFILSIIILIIIRVGGIFTNDQLAFLITANIAVLIYPHWFTGVRRILTTPRLVNKVGLYNYVLKKMGEELSEDSIEYLVYVKGKNEKFPTDAKLKVKFKNQPDDFLGMYAQISLNNVQGKDYPYFYVVLVAKEGFGLPKFFESLQLNSQNIIKELSHQDGVEIIVIRQYTTKTSGYHTAHHTIQDIMRSGMSAARRIIGN